MQRNCRDLPRIRERGGHVTSSTRAKFEDRFYNLLETLFKELDQEEIRREVEALRRERPLATRKQLAAVLTRRAAVSTAVVGAGAGAAGGAIGMLAMAPDIFNLVREQSRLILSIAFLYDQAPGREERFREVLATLAISTGASATRRGARYLIAKGLEAGSAKPIVRRIAGRFVARKLPAIAPVVGSLAGAGLNYMAVRATAKVAVDYYGRLFEESRPEPEAETSPTVIAVAPKSQPARSRPRTSTRRTTAVRTSGAKPSDKASAAKSGKKSSTKAATHRSPPASKKAAPKKTQGVKRGPRKPASSAGSPTDSDISSE